MRFLSGFSGIEAASVAWHALGWETAACMEIDPFACAVLEHRLPGVPNLGSVTGVDEHTIQSLGPFDLFVFGWPCQDHSVAGKRKGLTDTNGKQTRSGLFYDAARILRLAEQHAGCRWFVAENVPGVLSSNRGRDFSEVLREITGCTFSVPRDGWPNSGVVARNGGGWSAAWRVLDAQYVRVDGFGRAVPQRRRRVFVVGHLGDWRRAAAVLFDRESLSGHSPPRRDTGQVVAALTSNGVGTCGADSNQAQAGHLIPETSTAVRQHFGRGVDSDYTMTLVAHTLRGDGFGGSEDGTGRGVPLVPVLDQEQIPFVINAAESCATQSHARYAVSSRFLDQTGGFASNQGGTVVVSPAIAIQERAVCENPNAGPDGIGVRTDGVAYTLESRSVPQAVAFQERGRDGGRSLEWQDDLAYSLNAPSGGGRRHELNIAWRWAVRRLTPLECERLQGFPDGWTQVPYRGKPAADGPRYRAIGNSMAVNCMRWIGRRIQDADTET